MHYAVTLIVYVFRLSVHNAVDFRWL